MLPEESGSPTAAGYRIADVDRDRAVAVLRTHCTEGRITLDEFSDRVGLVYEARTSADLDAVLHDLQPRFPSQTVAMQPVRDGKRARGRRWVLAVFGSSTQRGRFRLEDESGALAVFGDKRCTTGDVRPLPGSPVVHVRALAVFGDVRVRPPRRRG